MTNETFRILLEAKHTEKGMCELTGSDAGQDLFGQWSIDVSGGRIGRRGRSVTYSAADDNDLHPKSHPPYRTRFWDTSDLLHPANPCRCPSR
jgi:hypothetical protein